MNDITALAQRMKAAAISAKELGAIARYSKGRAAIEAFIGLATPDNFLALVEALEKARQQNGYIREQSAEWERKAISNFEECAEMSARIEELESQRKLAFTAGNRWADKFREAEKRIAELESRTVTVKWPTPKDASQGWKIDPEFICKVQGEIGYDEEEGTPSMEVIEAVLLAAGIQVIEGEGQ